MSDCDVGGEIDNAPDVNAKVCVELLKPELISSSVLI